MLLLLELVLFCLLSSPVHPCHRFIDLLLLAVSKNSIHGRLTESTHHDILHELYRLYSAFLLDDRCHRCRIHTPLYQPSHCLDRAIFVVDTKDNIAYIVALAIVDTTGGASSSSSSSSSCQNLDPSGSTNHDDIPISRRPRGGASICRGG